MQDEILEIIKSKYLSQKAEQENYQKIQARLLELTNNKYVKEYLALQEESNKNKFNKKSNYTDQEIMYQAFRHYISKIKETNGIYIYLGTFKPSNICDIEHGPSDDRVNYYDPSAEYRIYQDIESFMSTQVPIKFCEEFEKKHQIIFPKTYLTEKAYYQLQQEFIEDCIEFGQEVAITKILKKSRK